MKRYFLLALLLAAVLLTSCRTPVTTPVITTTPPFTSEATPATPAWISPHSGATEVGSKSVLFQWSPVPGATEYQVILARDADFKSIVTSVNVTSTAVYDVSISDNTTYFWSVRVIKPNPGKLAIGRFTTFDQKVGEGHYLALFTPIGGYTTPLRPSFSWSSVPGAVEYEFVLATDAALRNVVFKLNLPETSYQLTFDLELATTYFWAVRAIKPSQSLQIIGSFKTRIPQTSEEKFPAPTLKYPQDGATYYPTFFSWSEIPGATEYRLVVAKDIDFKSIVASVNVMVNSVEGIPFSETRRAETHGLARG